LLQTTYHYFAPMKLSLSAKIVIGFLLLIVCSLVSFWVNLKLSSEVIRNSEFVSRSEVVIRNSANIHKIILDMQSSFRGFLLTENKIFLQPYTDRQQELAALFAEEKQLLKGSRRQLGRLEKAEKLHKQWLAYTNSLVEAKLKKRENKSSSEEYENLFAATLQKEVGKKITDSIDVVLKEFDKSEYSLRQKRRDKLNHSIDVSGKVTLMLLLVTISIGIVSVTYITLHLRHRIRSMVKLAESISQGKFDSVHDTANDELTSLSLSLNDMSGKLKKSFTELEAYAYVVSHDLKEPLRGMYNLAHWIEEDFGKEMPPLLQGYIDKLKGRIYRMESLIRGLLEYSRVGREPVINERVDTKELVVEIVEAIVPKEFLVKTKGLPVLITERIRLQQVFSNLIGNAVKYQGGKERGSIVISCKEARVHYQFTITDNGVGIEPEYHKKIFGLFQTLREKNQSESTGIGLSIVKKIIEDRKGQIWLRSEKGKGTSFFFTWPKEPLN